jgi:hypothetical protein
LFSYTVKSDPWDNYPFEMFAVIGHVEVAAPGPPSNDLPLADDDRPVACGGFGLAER